MLTRAIMRTVWPFNMIPSVGAGVVVQVPTQLVDSGFNTALSPFNVSADAYPKFSPPSASMIWPVM